MTETVAFARRQARECAIRFLYQSERDKTYYFIPGAFLEFCENFPIDQDAVGYAQELARGSLDRQEEIDKIIGDASQNWSVSRLGSTDRCVLRVAVFELLKKGAPPKVVLDEAIELARLYGTENSGRFVNGVLDKILKLI